MTGFSYNNLELYAQNKEFRIVQGFNRALSNNKIIIGYFIIFSLCVSNPHNDYLFYAEQMTKFSVSSLIDFKA